MATSLPPPSYPHSMTRKTLTKTRAKGDHDDISSLARSLLQARLANEGSGAPASTALVPSDVPSPSPVTTTRTRQRLAEVERERDALRGAIPPPTSSRTRAELAQMKLERDKLKSAVEKERAVAERLKYEGRTSEMTAADKESRFRSLKHDRARASRGVSGFSSGGLFKNICSTDLLFLIDTTGSMDSYIEAAKDQCKSIMYNVDRAFLGKAEVRMAVVGYKDHQDSPNIQFLDFTTDIDRVHSFLSSLVATGGGDTPEDVLGGLHQALNATWSHQNRCIIHVADAPPHGTALQGSPLSDKYPIPGSEPHGLRHEPLLAQMLDLKINYALLRIDDLTDFMVKVFADAYLAAGADVKLHVENDYYEAKYNRAKDSLSRGTGYSKRNPGVSGLLFEEAELGTSYDALQHLVLKVVTASATRTAMRVSAAARRGRGGRASIMTAIDEEGDAPDVPLENLPPQWHRDGWLDETLKVEGFSPDIGVHSASTLNDMIVSEDNIAMSISQLTIKKRSRPFAQGAMRTASYARTAYSTNLFVVKAFKKRGKALAHVAEDMQGQAMCKAFALEFNALTRESTPLDFLVTTCFKGKDKAGTKSDDDCMSLEPYIPGEYVKYNSNCGWVHDDGTSRLNMIAQAFSHFTFERSRGKFLVCDLQGVGHIMTDPCIHTKDKSRFPLSDTNFSEDGFMLFFATHTCNTICTALGLRSESKMFATEKWEFRESWPRLDNVECCSNKLCGKIIPLNSAKHTEQYPGYKWCSVCWPQLKSTDVKRVCVAEGPHHQFTASAFFFESQGQVVPRKCPKHRGESEPCIETAMAVIPATAGAIVPMTAGVVATDKVTMKTHKGFWNRLKFARRKSSESGSS